MSATRQFVRATVDRFGGLAPLLDEHLRDNFGELLPHVFMGDVTRYVVRLAMQLGTTSHPDTYAAELREILDHLDAGYSQGDEAVRELIAASFLENLPCPDEEGAIVREMLGPNLRAHLILFE